MSSKKGFSGSPSCRILKLRNFKKVQKACILRVVYIGLHAFHESCVQDWFLRSGTCPTCNTDVCAGMAGGGAVY